MLWLDERLTFLFGLFQVFKPLDNLRTQFPDLLLALRGSRYAVREIEFNLRLNGPPLRHERAECEQRSHN